MGGKDGGGTETDWSTVLQRLRLFSAKGGIGASGEAPPGVFKSSGAGSLPWLLAVVGSVISSMPIITDW